MTEYTADRCLASAVEKQFSKLRGKWPLISYKKIHFIVHNTRFLFEIVCSGSRDRNKI